MERLRASLSGGDRKSGLCDDAVDVGDDRKVTDFGLICHKGKPPNRNYRIKAQRSGFDPERTSSGVSELSPLGESEGYGACEDEAERRK